MGRGTCLKKTVCCKPARGVQKVFGKAAKYMVRSGAVRAGSGFKSSGVAKLIELDKENMYFKPLPSPLVLSVVSASSGLRRVARSTTEEVRSAEKLHPSSYSLSQPK
jgi:hypothetical protein